MTEEILDRPTTKPAKARADSAVLERLEAVHRRHQDHEFRMVADRLEALRGQVAAERKEILPPDLRRTVEAEMAGCDPRGPGLRYHSLAKAREYGVDLLRLRELYTRAHRQFDDIVRKDIAFASHETLVGSLADTFHLPPIAFTPPDPDKEKMFFAPYASQWDRLQSNQASGDGAVDENVSYLDGSFARLGSRLRAHNHDAADVDVICAYREGGYLVPFKMLKTGVLQVKADLSALFCRHHVSTDDEWGWSDFHATTRGRLILAVFWDFADEVPTNEVSDQWFVSGIDCSGDGEDYPGTRVEAVPGERRIINLFTDMAFPAGKLLWVYVGLSDRIYAFLNDVSIDISIDSAWQLNSLAIRSL